MGVGYTLMEEIKTEAGVIKNPDFTDYKIPTVMDIQYIRAGIVEEKEPSGPFKAKGFSEATSREAADMLVVFYAAVHNRRDFVPPSYRVGRWGRVWRTSPGHVVRYKEGTLVIDIVDQKRKELVWQGVGKGVLDRSNPASNLLEAVQKILEKFPPEE